MRVSDMSHLDLEIGGGGGGEDGGSMCFSDEGSCNSQFYSTADGDDYSSGGGSEILEESRRSGGCCCSCGASSSPDDDDIEENGEFGEKNSDDDRDDRKSDDMDKGHLGIVDRDCRICHLSLVSSSPAGAGISIRLGCSCKGDLAAAHKHCAETWFKIKGDKTCEICNSIARNVVGPSDNEGVGGVQHVGESASLGVAAVSSASVAAESRRGWINGHRLLNLILACMVFAFVISWLFHFNIPS